MMTTRVTKKALVGAMMAPNRHPLLLLLICSLHRSFPVPSNVTRRIMALQATPARLRLRPFRPMEPTTALIHTAEVPKELRERPIRPIVAKQVVAMEKLPALDSQCRLAAQVE